MTTGCMQIQLDMELNSDNSGKFVGLSAINTDMFDEDGESKTSVSVLEEIRESEGLKVVETPITYTHNGSTYTGEKVEVSFNNSEDFINLYQEEELLRLIDLGNGINRLEIDFSDDVDTNEDSKDAGDFDIGAMIEATGGKMVFTFKTDYEVLNHNADSVENGVLTWNLLKLMTNPELANKPLFIEYAVSEVSEVKDKLVDKSRTGVEKWLGIEKQDKSFYGKALNKLGILQGTGNGLELDRALNRVEGAIMYSRLLGVENEINQFAKSNPNYKSGFSDIPAWAEKTINYLHYKNLVMGVGNGKYGSTDPMTEAQYSTLVLRALGYNDSKGDFNWSTANKTIEDVGVFNGDNVKPKEILGGNFIRETMSYISYNALFFENKTTGETLIDKLIK